MINDEKIQRSALRLRLDPNDRAQRESLMAALLETLQVIRRPFPAKSGEDWNPEEFCKKLSQRLDVLKRKISISRQKIESSLMAEQGKHRQSAANVKSAMAGF
jgi:hypothetical protein